MSEKPRDGGEWMAHAGPPPETPPPPPADTPALGEDAAMNAALPPGETTLGEPPVSDLGIGPELSDAIEEPLASDGELVRTLEWYFPVAWVAMLMIVCYIGIYYAVDRLAGPNPLPPALNF